MPEPSADTWDSPSLWWPKPWRLQCAGRAPGLPARVALPEACQVNLLLPGPGPEKPSIGFQVGPDTSSPGLMVYKNSSKKLEAVTPKLSCVTERLESMTSESGSLGHVSEGPGHLFPVPALVLSLLWAPQAAYPLLPVSRLWLGLLAETPALSSILWQHLAMAGPSQSLGQACQVPTPTPSPIVGHGAKTSSLCPPAPASCSC